MYMYICKMYRECKSLESHRKDATGRYVYKLYTYNLIYVKPIGG